MGKAKRSEGLVFVGGYIPAVDVARIDAYADGMTEKTGLKMSRTEAIRRLCLMALTSVTSKDVPETAGKSEGAPVS